MAIAGELKSADAVSSSQLVATGTKAALHFLHYRSTDTAGTVVLKTGGSGGTVKVTINTPALAQSNSMPFPAGGLHFDEGIYAELTDVDGVTILYQEE